MKNNLSAILGARLMTITQLAELTGVSRTTLTDIYYKRAKSVKLETLVKICDALEIPLCELIEYQPKKEA